jgi:hypothetical protein
VDVGAEEVPKVNVHDVRLINAKRFLEGSRSMPELGFSGSEHFPPLIEPRLSETNNGVLNSSDFIKVHLS